MDGLKPLPEKLEAIKKLLAPTNMNELCQFLAITGFYRKCVHFYANITNCLTKLLRKGAEFQWSKQCNNAFNILKEELCKMPSLQYPDPNKPFKLFTDASNYSYSGILHQAQDEEPDQLIPTAYFSEVSTKHSNFGMSPKKNATLCTGQLINFPFTLQGQSAPCNVIISHWLHS